MSDKFIIRSGSELHVIYYITNRSNLKINIASAVVLLFLSGSTTNTAMNYVRAAYAQSGSATKQQASRSSPQPSQPLVSQVFTFNDKSLSPNAPNYVLL
jgi:hypothetical protein